MTLDNEPLWSKENFNQYKEKVSTRNNEKRDRRKLNVMEVKTKNDGEITD